MELRSAAVSCRYAASWRVAGVVLAGAVEPKSMSTGARSAPSRMLCGLMSRWARGGSLLVRVVVRVVRVVGLVRISPMELPDGGADLGEKGEEEVGGEGGAGGLAPHQLLV